MAPVDEAARAAAKIMFEVYREGGYNRRYRVVYFTELNDHNRDTELNRCLAGESFLSGFLAESSRKEGRALGEVTKFLVYNARKRQEGGDRADAYFARTECVAGVQDVRFQELMPDVLHWLGITRIHRFVSMSNVKYDAITKSGITIGQRVKIPDGLVPADARVEIEAKIAAGYYTEGSIPPPEMLAKVKGRELDE